METKSQDAKPWIRVLFIIIGAFSIIGVWTSFGWEMGGPRGIAIVILSLVVIFLNLRRWPLEASK